RLVVAILEKAHQLQIPTVSMITNGAWGKSKEAPERLAVKLKNAGLTTVDISVDAFHQQHIPLQLPRNAAAGQLRAGVEEVVWNVAVVESLKAANEYDEKTARILKELEPVGIETHTVKIVPIGRALQNLRRYFDPSSLTEPCDMAPITGNTLTNPKSVCIEPSGSANTCWNLTVGNAKITLLRRLIAEYD
ncbi:MAG: hypothetical protein WCC63_01875, partial [Candidatus Bathyarchaeia archaeon]